MEFKFDLFEKESIGTIELGDKVRISDPCYDVDTWCAGTLENVLPGKYNCFSQRVDEEDWGIRIASIEIRHRDYDDVEPTEIQNIDVGVDSGQCGIYDLDYFVEAKEKDEEGDDEWYCEVCDSTFKYVDNPNYVPFEESTYCNTTEHKYINFVLNNNLPTDNISGYDMFSYIEALKNYHKDKCSFEHIGMSTASLLDNQCIVSSSGDGDGCYTCLVGRNEEEKIVSIKIDYYYGYDEEECDEE